MTKTTQWEYRVETIGSAFKSPKDEEIEALLNAWGEDGWEVISVNIHPSSGKISLAAKRLLETSTRRRRSLPSTDW
jgi:hypothetical protein